MIHAFKRTGWKVLLLLAAAVAVPACAEHNVRQDEPGRPSSPHGNQAPTGPSTP